MKLQEQQQSCPLSSAFYSFSLLLFTFCTTSCRKFLFIRFFLLYRFRHIKIIVKITFIVIRIIFLRCDFFIYIIAARKRLVCKYSMKIVNNSCTFWYLLLCSFEIAFIVTYAKSVGISRFTHLTFTGSFSRCISATLTGVSPSKGTFR